MLIHCSNCNEPKEVKIDRESIDIKNPDPIKANPVCQSCGKSVAISAYMIRAMISQREFTQETSDKKSFSYPCSGCGKISQAQLKKTTPDKDSSEKPRDYAACEKCGADLKLTQIMLKLLKDKK